jgi:uncharacterized protein YjbI with pentapeptide repeats
MSDVDGTCEYALDPNDPETWGGEEGDECYVDEGVLNDDGIWKCPHSAEDGKDLCIFHIETEEKKVEETTEAFLHTLDKETERDGHTTTGRKSQFLGAKFSELKLKNEIVKMNRCIDMTHTEIEGVLDWSHSTFDVESIQFRKIMCADNADFDSVEFRCDVDFNSAEFKESANFDSVMFGGDTDFNRAEFRGAADFSNVTFSGSINFGGLTEKESLEDAKFAGRFGGSNIGVGFVFDNIDGGVEFKGDTGFNSADFKGDTNFNLAKFTGDVLFQEAKFEKVAEFNFVDFGRDVNFMESEFNSDFLSRGTTFRGDIDFGYTTFKSDIEFKSVEFKQLADFRSTDFEGDANFETSIFEGDAYFGGPNQAALFGGDAVFRRANFNGDAVFRSARFEGNAVFRRAKFGGDTIFQNAELGTVDFKEVSLESADFEGADLSGAILERAKLSGADLFSTNLSGAYLYGARVGDVGINTETVFDEYGEHRCVYDPNSEYEYVPDGEEQVGQLRKAMGTYHVLEQLTRANTLPDEQAKFFARRQDMRRAQLREEGRRVEYWFAEAQNAIFRHGESFSRVVGWSVGTIVAFAFIFPLGGWLQSGSTGTLTYGAIAESPQLMWQSFYHSALLFLTGGGPLAPTGFIGEVLTTIEALIAPILLALLIFVLGRRAAR